MWDGLACHICTITDRVNGSVNKMFSFGWMDGLIVRCSGICTPLAGQQLSC